MNGNIYALRVIVFDFEGQSEPGDNVFEEKSSFSNFQKMCDFLCQFGQPWTQHFSSPGNRLDKLRPRLVRYAAEIVGSGENSKNDFLDFKL